MVPASLSVSYQKYGTTKISVRLNKYYIVFLSCTTEKR